MTPVSLISLVQDGQEGRTGGTVLEETAVEGMVHPLELCWKIENPTHVCGSITSDGCKVGSRQKCIAIAVRVCSKLHTTWPHTLRLRAAILLALLRRDP